jgi:uncharacterized protein
MSKPIRIGSIEVTAGHTGRFYLPVGELADGMSQVRVPVWTMRGAIDGPVLYLHSGAHGQETVYSFEALRRLFGAVDPKRLRGTLIAVPIANPLAHLAGSRLSPQYGAREGIAFAGDLHKVWPGDEAGSITQRIAAVLWRDLVSLADAVVDYHAVSLPGMPFAFMYRGGKSDVAATPVWHESLALAGAFGFTTIETAPNPLTLTGACLDVGKPAFMVEMPAARVVEEPVVAATLRGTMNVLRHLGMLTGPLEAQQGFPILAGLRRALPSIRATRGGIISFASACGEQLQQGAVIARIHDALGVMVEEIRMPQSGYVMTYPALSWVGTHSVASGDYAADIFA